MCQKGTDLLSVVLLNRTGRERSSPAAALHTFQHQQLILIDSSPSSSPATVLSIFLFIPFFCFIFDPKSSGSLFSPCKYRTVLYFSNKKKEEEKVLPSSLMYRLAVGIQVSNACIFIVSRYVSKALLPTLYYFLCVLPTRPIHPGRFLYFSRPTE